MQDFGLELWGCRLILGLSLTVAANLDDVMGTRKRSMGELATAGVRVSPGAAEHHTAVGVRCAATTACCPACRLTTVGQRGADAQRRGCAITTA
jgi:hypothetical protein